MNSRVIATVIVLAVLLQGSFPVFANPLGVGAGESGLLPTGMFGSIFAWVQSAQQEFYRSLTGALRSMRDGEGGILILIGLSFAYGVFHAAGPGHGKAIISSYMLANEVALRRGILLSFLSSLLQGMIAILLIGAVFLFLRGTSVSMRDASHFLEVASFALVTAFGAWLLCRKLRSMMAGRPPATLSAARHDHSPGQACASCGHLHAPDPRLLETRKFDLRAAWTAIAAVGLRPCSGALIVLSFAFLNGLWAGGILAVLAMSIGTAITVSLLATLAVSAKNLASGLAASHAGRVQDVIEIAGALMVLLLGFLLLGASLQA